MGAMSTPGWYPDPGGAPGQFRYWDGSAWAATTSPFPGGPSPASGQPAPAGSAPLASNVPPAARQTAARTPYVPYGAAPYGGVSQTPGAAPQRGGRGGLLALIVVLAVIAGLIWGAINLLGGLGLGPAARGGDPASAPTANACPRPRATPGAEPRLTADGRVVAGKLSYPALGDPWSEPVVEDRLAYGTEAYSQMVPVETNYSGRSSWVASVLVAGLTSGDGFLSPQQGTDLVMKCVLGEFYGDAVVERKDVTSKAMTVSGKPAWKLETHLSFDIKGLKEKGETATLIVVQTGDASAGLYYASIPDSRPDLLATSRALESQLRVEG